MRVLIGEGDGERHYLGSNSPLGPRCKIRLDVDLAATIDDEVERLGNTGAILVTVRCSDHSPAIRQTMRTKTLVEQQLSRRTLDVGIALTILVEEQDTALVCSDRLTVAGKHPRRQCPIGYTYLLAVELACLRHHVAKQI